MTEELQRLWVLCGLDEEVAKLRAALDRHPQLKEEAATRVAESRSQLEQHRERAATAQKERRELERQAEALGEQERKFQSQLPQVKKNEEYQALLHEIGSTKQRRSELETKILMTLEDEERIGVERKTIEGALATAEREMRERVTSIEAEEREERERLEALGQRRAAELDGLSAATRARYERIHTSRQGRAVVPIDKNACGGCYRALPPQILQEARRRDRILNCEGCGRLVLLPPDSP